MKYGLVLRTKKYYGIKTHRLRKCHADFCHPKKKKKQNRTFKATHRWEDGYKIINVRPA